MSVHVLYAEFAHCLKVDCTLAEALLCVITVETKPIDQSLPIRI